MAEKYLPVGTVVLLKNATKRIMIVGYLPMTSENKVFDYSACTFPEGVINSDKTLCFNHDQIEKIDFVGLADEDQKGFNVKIKDALGKFEAIKKVEFPQA